MTEVDIDYLRQWSGRSETQEDVLTPARASAVAAMLDHVAPPSEGDELPPLWHWTFLLPTVRQSELGADGHPKLGGFMPPVPLPQRMWVGGRLRFEAPIRIGDRIERRTEIGDITAKSGKRGALVFVTLRHEVRGPAGLAISEEQDIVYREAEPAGAVQTTPQAPKPPADPTEADWRDPIQPDPVLLFRYSAVTFNAHRIHYDARYARDVEGYPGLVVQGPLTATLLADRLMRRAGGSLREFSFRAVQPLFCDQPINLCGRRLETGKYDIWAETPSGHPAMTASARFALAS